MERLWNGTELAGEAKMAASHSVLEDSVLVFVTRDNAGSQKKEQIAPARKRIEK